MPVAIRPDAASADPRTFAAAVHDAVEAGQRLRIELGDQACEVEADAAIAVLAVLAAAGTGEALEVNALPPELTTGQAADLLGVSRPTVVSLVDDGLLPASRVGTHRRLRTVDVLAYRMRARENRRGGVDRIVAASRDLGLYDE